MAQKSAWSSRKLWGTIAAGLAVFAMIAVVWMDVATGVWQETVILSGIAAGLLTFVLTAFFIERFLDQRDRKSWQPVTRLALTDLLHTVSDDEKSDIHRGAFVARTFAFPEPVTPESLDALLHEIVAERDRVTAALARWAGFLAGSANVQPVMTHIANLAESYDQLRDAVLETEQEMVGFDVLRGALASCNQDTVRVIRELEDQIGKLEPGAYRGQITG